MFDIIKITEKKSLLFLLICILESTTFRPFAYFEVCVLRFFKRHITSPTSITMAGWGKSVHDKEYTKPTQQLKITNQTQGDYIHDAETQK